MHELRRQLFIPRPINEVFDFFSRAANLESITPPFLRFQLTTPEPLEVRAGTRIAYRLRVRGVPIRWLTEIEVWDPPHQFVDTQLRGPYRHWRHTHTFTPSGSGTIMTDHVAFELPFGPLGRAVYKLQVRRDVEAIFDYRERSILARFSG